MTGAFALVAATLATFAALVLLWPLLRRRSDARPADPLTAAAVIVAVLLGGAGLYMASSNFKWTDAPAVADTPAAMAAQLARKLQDDPDNLEGWLMLGRSYAVLEQFPLAIRAYQRADRVADGKNAEALLGQAEARFALNPDEMAGRAGQLFEHALELEPGNAKALFYAAFAALARGDAPVARERFNRMLALNPPPNIREIIEQRLMALTNGGNETGGGETAADSAKIQVHITVAPALQGKYPPNAPLFVAARDPGARGPPFAARRLAATFPVDVELTAADAMLPSRHITAGQTLEVVARISLGGTPQAASGDLFGQVGYHVGTDGRLNIVIDRVAP